ncbi:MAG: glycosyltransferase family 2 protein [Solirubrobacterales bacterium]
MFYDTAHVTAGEADKSPAIDAVVVTWNRWELTEACIEHLLASTIDVHVIVVDNGSEDGTPDKLAEQYPQVEVIKLETNCGYGAAANIGIEASTHEYVATVNSDAFVAPDYFELVYKVLSKDPKMGFAAGISIDPSTNKIDAAGAIFDAGFRWSPYLNGAELEDVVIDQSVLAAPPPEAMLYRREAFLGVGGYDTEIFAYGEDLELTLRLRGAGWGLAVVPEARDVHKGAASLGKRTPAQMRLVGFGRGYVAGRYRLGIPSLVLDFFTYIAISTIVRSPGPFTQLVAGWRRGRALPARELPTNIHLESAVASLRKRWVASQD